MYCTGWKWLSEKDLDPTTDVTEFVNPGSDSARATTQERITEKLADGTVGIVETEGVSTLAIIPLFGTAGYSPGGGSGTSPAHCRVYGGIGFGEPRLTEFDANPVIWWQIGVIHGADIAADDATVCTSNLQGSDAQGTTNMLLTHPVTGTAYSCWVNTTANTNAGGGLISSTMIGLSQTNQAAPGSGSGEAWMQAENNTGVGVAFLPSVHIFQKVAFKFNEGSTTFTAANALVCKWT